MSDYFFASHEDSHTIIYKHNSCWKGPHGSRTASDQKLHCFPSHPYIVWVWTIRLSWWVGVVWGVSFPPPQFDGLRDELSNRTLYFWNLIANMDSDLYRISRVPFLLVCHASRLNLKIWTYISFFAFVCNSSLFFLVKTFLLKKKKQY